MEVNKGGRPAMFDTVEDLEKKINEYFVWCQGEYIEDEGERRTKVKNSDGSFSEVYETYKYMRCVREKEKPSITKLALWLGFESRQSMYDYKNKEKFSYTIKRACLEIESIYEAGLWMDKPTGAIFALKNMGWADKTENTIKGDSEAPLNIINLGSGVKP